MIKRETLVEQFDRLFNIKKVEVPISQLQKQSIQQNKKQTLKDIFTDVNKEKYMELYKQKKQKQESQKIKQKQNTSSSYSHNNKERLYDPNQQKSNNLTMPRNFHIFIFSKYYLVLLSQVREYAHELNKIELKQELLKDEAWEHTAQPKLLQSEIHRIEERARQISLTYSMIILNRREETKQHANNRIDQNFYESIVEHLDLVIGSFFEQRDYDRLREEINRLFRTNIFNQVKRERLNNKWKQKYPVLQQSENLINSKQQETNEQLKYRVEKLVQVPNQNIRKQFKEEKSTIKPLFLRQSACMSIHSRSPLVALMIPSNKEKIFNFDSQFHQRLTPNMSIRKQIDINELHKLGLKQFHSNFTGNNNNSNNNTGRSGSVHNNNRNRVTFMGQSKENSIISSQGNSKELNNSGQQRRGMSKSFYV